MRSDMPNVPADMRPLHNASYFRQVFLDIRAIFAGYASNLWAMRFGYADMRIMSLEGDLSMPDMLLILPV